MNVDNLTVDSVSIQKQMMDIINQIESRIKDLDSKIENNFEFMEDNIEVYIESLKMKLDELSSRYRVKLKEFKLKTRSLLQIDKLEEEIKVNRDEIQRHNLDLSALNTKSLYFAKTLKEIQEINIKMKMVSHDDFDNKIDTDSIFNILFDYGQPITQRLDSKINYLQLNVSPNKILVLNNGNIVIEDCTSYCLALYDTNFNLIKLIEELNGDIISIQSFSCDKDDNIYLANDSFCCMMKLDNELNLLKTLSCPRFEQLCTEANDALLFKGICVYDDQIYSCIDCAEYYKTNFISKISLDLESVSTIYLPHDQPLEIQILNNVACIKYELDYGRQEYLICFYKLPNFETLIEYNLSGTILVFDKWFYLLDKRLLIVFDVNGELKEQKTIDLNSTAYSFAISNNRLIVSQNDESITKIEFKDF